MNKKPLFIMLYPFMSSVLKLRGYAKEVFAIIFGFWLAAECKPVYAPMTTLQRMTGATRSTIAKALQYVESKHFIDCQRGKGKPTKYEVTIDSAVLAEFKSIYRLSPVRGLDQRESSLKTRSGSLAVPQNNKKHTRNNDSSLRVKDKLSTGGLPEAK